jgi:hypothetical protein
MTADISDVDQHTAVGLHSWKFIPPMKSPLLGLAMNSGATRYKPVVIYSAGCSTSMVYTNDLPGPNACPKTFPGPSKGYLSLWFLDPKLQVKSTKRKFCQGHHVKRCVEIWKKNIKYPTRQGYSTLESPLVHTNDRFKHCWQTGLTRFPCLLLQCHAEPCWCHRPAHVTACHIIVQSITCLSIIFSACHWLMLNNHFLRNVQPWWKRYWKLTESHASKALANLANCLSDGRSGE